MVVSVPVGSSIFCTGSVLVANQKDTGFNGAYHCLVNEAGKEVCCGNGAMVSMTVTRAGKKCNSFQ
jgi:hypothetical protein